MYGLSTPLCYALAAAGCRRRMGYMQYYLRLSPSAYTVVSEAVGRPTIHGIPLAILLTLGEITMIIHFLALLYRPALLHYIALSFLYCIDQIRHPIVCCYTDDFSWQSVDWLGQSVFALPTQQKPSVVSLFASSTVSYNVQDC